MWFNEIKCYLIRVTCEKQLVTNMDRKIWKLILKENYFSKSSKEGLRGYLGEWVGHVDQIFTFVLSV